MWGVTTTKRNTLTWRLNVTAFGWHFVQMPRGHGRCSLQPDFSLQLMFSSTANFPLFKSKKQTKVNKRILNRVGQVGEFIQRARAVSLPVARHKTTRGHLPINAWGHFSKIRVKRHVFHVRFFQITFVVRFNWWTMYALWIRAVLTKFRVTRPFN